MFVFLRIFENSTVTSGCSQCPKILFGLILCVVQEKDLGASLSDGLSLVSITGLAFMLEARGDISAWSSMETVPKGVGNPGTKTNMEERKKFHWSFSQCAQMHSYLQRCHIGPRPQVKQSPCTAKPWNNERPSWAFVILIPWGWGMLGVQPRGHQGWRGEGCFVWKWDVLIWILDEIYINLWWVSSFRISWRLKAWDCGEHIETHLLRTRLLLEASLVAVKLWKANSQDSFGSWNGGGMDCIQSHSWQYLLMFDAFHQNLYHESMGTQTA